MKTWKEFKNEHLSDFPDNIIEEVRKVTSFARHHERANEVHRLAKKYLESIGVNPIDYNIQALCALESNGTRGGGFYMPGAGTSRHSAFKSLPHRDSNSGEAWTAVITEIAGIWYWAGNRELCIAIPTRDGKMKFVPISKISDGKECSLVAARIAIRAAGGHIWRDNLHYMKNIYGQPADVIRAAARTLEKVKE